ncbi:hypothetical protein AFK71_11780 [Virgibacillus pantothenticus]|uniref:ABC transporter ATP-binding protein n=2 Tax=Virgibacillus pantothenticus TaxID=1473 RepID=A0A0L0QKQ7_VIRPA|nr:hypothetical protein AFK71_11780 [Virgibacillus pantothenticus]
MKERSYFQSILQRLAYHSIVIISTHLIDELQQSSEDTLLYLSEGKVAYFGDLRVLDTIKKELRKTGID